jgi:hypothetical protein
MESRGLSKTLSDYTIDLFVSEVKVATVPLKTSSLLEWPVRRFRVKADGWYVRLSLKVLLV